MIFLNSSTLKYIASIVLSCVIHEGHSILLCFEEFLEFSKNKVRKSSSKRWVTA